MASIDLIHLYIKNLLMNLLLVMSSSRIVIDCQCAPYVFAGAEPGLETSKESKPQNIFSICKKMVAKRTKQYPSSISIISLHESSE